MKGEVVDDIKLKRRLIAVFVVSCLGVATWVTLPWALQQEKSSGQEVSHTLIMLTHK